MVLGICISWVFTAMRNIQHAQILVLDTCTLIKKILVIVVISKNSSIFAIKTDKNFIKL